MGIIFTEAYDSGCFVEEHTRAQEQTSWQVTKKTRTKFFESDLEVAKFGLDPDLNTTKRR